MVVALLGVGADGTNTVPTPPIYQDGTFEYIPIPEREGPEGTVENRTYGNTELRNQDRTVADFVDKITPWSDGPDITGAKLAEWPFHYDPNFDALTYGESTNRGAYAQTIRQLEPGDIIAFYTGLSGPNSRYTHRYVIGYFTVDSILDFQNISYGDETLTFSELPHDEQDRIMREHRENAHAKRYLSSGEISDGDGLILVDGCPPGGLLNHAFRISEHSGGGHHYLTDDLQQKFSPEAGKTPEKNAYLGGIKQAHRLNISSGEFVDIVGQPFS